MHTVHLAEETKNGLFAAAMGLMFSVEDYNIEVEEWQRAIIDKFFDSLDWTNFSGAPKVNEVPYGELMMMVDMNNRWIYQGSVTTPPCKQNVYWNVLTTIYPIKRRHLDQFKKQLEKAHLLKTGNWRVIQKLTD